MSTSYEGLCGMGVVIITPHNEYFICVVEKATTKAVVGEAENPTQIVIIALMFKTNERPSSNN